MKALTVFTPTFNRKDTLNRLYESLILQNDREYFEWLVIDDGSEDGTESEIKKFIEEDKIDIRYLRKENGGKPSAYNLALETAESPLFFCVDSDDWLLPNAVAFIRANEKRLLNNKLLSGIAGRSADKYGNPLEKEYKKEFVSDTMRIRDVYKGKDKPEIMKTEMLKKFRFPIIEGEKFITEAIVFDALTKEFPILYTNALLMGKEYLKNGMTDRAVSLRLKNVKGTLMYYKQRVNLTETYFGKLKAKINYVRFQLHAGEKITKYRYLIPIAKQLYKRDLTEE